MHVGAIQVRVCTRYGQRARELGWRMGTVCLNNRCCPPLEDDALFSVEVMLVRCGPCCALWYLLSPAALLDLAGDVIPLAVPTRHAIDNIATDLACAAGHTSTRSSALWGFRWGCVVVRTGSAGPTVPLSSRGRRRRRRLSVWHSWSGP